MSGMLGMGGTSVVVLGGGQGIGATTALIFAEAGTSVAVVDIDRARRAFRPPAQHGARPGRRALRVAAGR